MMLHKHTNDEDCFCITDTEEQAQNIKKKMEGNRHFGLKIADFLTEYFGTVSFFILNLLWFFIWIFLNVGVVPGLPPFDPYPFGLLTMIVSLEAIFLSIIVLISQNRASHIDSLREELDLKVNIRAEEEITKVINMLDEIHDHLGIQSAYDGELEKMKLGIDFKKMEKDLLSEMTKK